MTIADLLTDEALRLKEFPVAKEKVFLGHAAVCPMPRRVAEAVSNFSGQCTGGDQETILPDLVEDTRKLGARLLNCQTEEVAFVGPTSIGLSYVASGLKFRRGDNVLVYFDDYPSNVYPWMALAEQGVEVRLLNVRNLGVIRAKDVTGQVDENTRLVALASCHFISGHRIDVAAIGKYLRDRKILFCLDAIQTLGAFPTPIDCVDFLAADSHKWLLGPCGTGLFYVRRELQEKLNPPVYGWHNVRCPNFVSQEQITYRGGAKKFEAGTHNLVGIAGLAAAMGLILEVGVENIADELRRKRTLLVPALQARGFTVLQADASSESASGIVTFSKPGCDLAALHQKLLDAHVVTSLRTDRSGQRHIRLSPHFYNTDAELNRVLELL